jgi:hypothetical protein
MDWNDVSMEYAMLQERAVAGNKSGAERALDHLKQFGIDDRTEGKVSELSGGEILGVDLDDGYVRFLASADYLGAKLSSISQRDLDFP